MKRLISSISGKESYGRKWQNIESSIDSENDRDDSIHSSHVKSTDVGPAPLGSTETTQVPSKQEAGELELATVTHLQHNQNQIRQGKNIRRRSSPDEETMYRAAIKGDWLAAEILLSRNPNLATDYVTDEGDRALHVAAAMKHKNFVQNLVNRMNEEDDLLLLDGYGYTAFCYAAVSGEVEIARLMIEKKPTLVTTRDANNVTSLHKAALSRRNKMVSYLLESTKVEDLSNQEWFDILLVAIQEEMFDVAIELVAKNYVIATMGEDGRTALHLLAQLEMPNVNRTGIYKLLEMICGVDFSGFSGKRPSNFVKLAEKLWAEMLKMEKTSLLELIKKQHILHDAAKAGHVELVTMLVRSYPQLILDTDSDGYTIFHIAVTYRQRHVFSLIDQVKDMVLIHSTRTISVDKDGNNILHLAAKLSEEPLNRTKLPPPTLLERELSWFQMTMERVPYSYQEMKNNDGLKPRDLFSKTHRRMLNDSRTWMMNSADSYMLIATILLSVVFTAAFAIPGGYDSQTGKPILLERKKFKDFILFEIFGLTGSVLSILVFRSIMTSNFAESDFLTLLPLKMLIGFQFLLVSLWGAIGAFMSSFELVYGKVEYQSMKFSRYTLYIACYLWIFREFGRVLEWELVNMLRSIRPSKHTLFS